MTAPLLALDLSKLQRLRSEKHAELKNELMMSVLLQMDWFVAFSERLDRYRMAGAVAPPYPSARVEQVATRSGCRCAAAAAVAAPSACASATGATTTRADGTPCHRCFFKQTVLHV